MAPRAVISVSCGLLTLAVSSVLPYAAASNASSAPALEQPPSLRGAEWPAAANASQGVLGEVALAQLQSALPFSCPQCDAHCRRAGVNPCDPSWTATGYEHNGWCWHLCRDPKWQCDGNRQSPIEIPVGIPSSGSWNLLRLARYQRAYGLSAQAGHSGLEVHVPRGKTLGSLYLDHEYYSVVQFHFHCGSEHKDSRGGVTHIYACEMHVVHANPRDTKKAVVALRYKWGLRTRPNGFLSRLGVSDEPSLFAPHLGRVRGSIDLRRELGILRKGFYSYDGSLTTPPCTENVKWFVAAATLPMSWQQLQSMKSLGLVSNRRDTFPSSGRGVKMYSR